MSLSEPFCVPLSVREVPDTVWNINRLINRLEQLLMISVLLNKCFTTLLNYIKKYY